MGTEEYKQRSVPEQWGQSVQVGGERGTPIRIGRSFELLHVDGIGDEWPVSGLQLVLGRNGIERTAVANVDFRALVTVGGGATSYSFACEWQNGTGITVVGKSVTVAVMPYQVDPNRTMNDQGLVADLSAVVGPRGNAGLAPVFQDQRTLEADEDVALTPPVLAKAVSIYCSLSDPSVNWWDDPSPYADLMARFEHASATGNPWGVIPGQVCPGGGAIPIGAGDTVLRLANAGDATMRVVALWHLGP